MNAMLILLAERTVSVFFSVSRAVFTPDLKLVFFDAFLLLMFPKAFISKHSFLIL